MTEWLTTTEAADVLGMSDQSVRGWLRNPAMRSQLDLRRLGPDTRGGQWLISATSIERIRLERAANPPRAGRPAHANPSALAVAKRRSRAGVKEE